MMYMRKVILFLLFCYTSLASATNYYVSSSAGNDGLDGKSQLNAWKTISKVNSKTFLPGDSILFKKGDVWREELLVPSSGTSASYIVFSSYGSGDNPKILGSTQATTWTDQGSNIWKSVATFANPQGFPADIHFIASDKSVAWGNWKTTTGLLVAEYNWTWSANYIYVYSPANPATRYSSIEIPQRFLGVDTQYKEYLDFNGIDVLFAGYMGFDSYSQHSDHQNKYGLIIQNCEIGHIGGIINGQVGFGIGVVYSNLIIRKCSVHDCGRRGISLDIYGSGFTARNAVIEDNKLYNGFHTTAIDISVGNASYTGSWDSVIIRKNLIYEEGDNFTPVAVSNQIFLQNWDKHTGPAVLSKVYIYNNIFKYTHANAIAIEATQSTYVYNNTFYGHNKAIYPAYTFYADTDARKVKIKNNIFYTLLSFDTSGSGAEVVTTSVTTSELDVDYNLYYRISNSLRIMLINGASYYMNQIANIRSMYGWDAHSPTPANPLFVSATDYHVQGGSPAIGAGVAIPGITTDFEGNAYTNPPNIGCYATPSITSNPTYLGSVVENAAPSLIELRYNITLANIVPATSAFSVMVNSVSRSVSSIAISGAKVQLSLASPVVFGDVVTVAYTKPASNSIQSSAGAEAVSFTAQTVTNNVNPPSPVYVSSAIENATSTLIEMTYNLTLANIVPAASAFSVLVNSVNRTVNTVTISGTKVRLTLASSVAYGDIVTVAYTVPATNPLQSSSGGKAITISAKTVTNNVNPAIPSYVSSVIENATPTSLVMTYSLTLASITPAATAFTVMVNSAARTINSVVITGTKVQLTLSSAVVFGDIVTVAYTKPAVNPLQASSGGQAANLSASAVTNSVSPSNPICISSVIENATPALLEMTYQLTLANIIPSATAFTVTVNSATRSINSVTINGTKVQLTLASAVIYGDIVTVAYTKPAINPLQTSSGGQAATFSSKVVTNNVSPANPVYISSVIENATPSSLEISFSLSLANISPDVTAFKVIVNSVSRTVNSILINGTKVKLTLASAVVNSEVVTVAYTKPAFNPLQSNAGGQVSTFTAQTVINNIGVVNIPPEINMVFSDTCISGFVGQIDASASTDGNNDILTFEWIAQGEVDISSATGSKIQFLAPIVSISETIDFILSVSDGKSVQKDTISITIVPYTLELSQADLTAIDASSYLVNDFASNIADGASGTFWSADGDNQWITGKLKVPFRIDHLKLSFSDVNMGGSFFDILASKDSLSWDPLLTNSTSCGFSDKLQIFPSQGSNLNTYSFIKLVGHGNSLNTLNKISELQVFGGAIYSSSDLIEIGMTVYPNPAQDFINIFFKNSLQEKQIIRIINISGNFVYQESFDTGLNYLQIPVTFPPGFYIIQLISNERIREASKILIQK